MQFLKPIWRTFGLLALVLVAATLAGCMDDGDKPTPGYYNPTGMGSGKHSGGFPMESNAPSWGGGSNSARVYHLRVGDELVVTFLDLNPPVSPVNQVIQGDGKLTLLFQQEFVAVGKTIPELQKEIQSRYVPSYYKQLTANIALGNRYYTVGGEIRQPNRFQYNGPTRLIEVINAAGWFTDFASHTVTVTHEDLSQERINCNQAQKDPSLNIEILPGDAIFVPKAPF